MEANNKNLVGWFEMYVEDMDRAKKFYENVFQRKTEKLESPKDGLEMWAFPGDMESYGAACALVKMQGVKPGVGGSLAYFSVDDCAVEEARVTEFGGKVENSKFSIGEHGFISICFDTEGNVFGLHSHQ